MFNQTNSIDTIKLSKTSQELISLTNRIKIPTFASNWTTQIQANSTRFMGDRDEKLSHVKSQ